MQLNSFTHKVPNNFFFFCFLLANYCNYENNLKGILHRDLKPENILVKHAQTLILKLADFGVSTPVLTNQRALTKAAGTAGYRAPESLSGRYTDKVDIFSVGVIFVQIFKGKAAFKQTSSYASSSAFDLQSKIDDGEAVFDLPNEERDNCPKACARLISKMLSFSPKERPSAKHALKVFRESLKELREARELKELSEASRTKRPKSSLKTLVKERESEEGKGKEELFPAKDNVTQN